MADRFYIGPYDSSSGLQTNLRPFVIPEKAFALLRNLYVWRGRVRKRFGGKWIGNSQLSTRLRVSVGTVAAPVSPVPLNAGAVGQMFSIGDVIFTVNALGAPANLLVANGTATTATFNTNTGAFTFTNVRDAGGVLIPGATPIYWYPALPVMGLIPVETALLNNEPTYAFDTRFAYQYISGSGWERMATGAAQWSGSDTQFFSGVTWSGTEPYNYLFFVTNFNQNEANFMRYESGGTWFQFRPVVSVLVAGQVLGITLDAAKFLVVFKNRLVALNTWETSDDGVNPPSQNNYPNRARYSQIGSPIAAEAWRQDLEGRGNAIDCPTRQQIVGVQFIKDRLIVYFERSTWELVYLGNVAYPFGWQQINSELGVESGFSVVPFDRVAIGVGQNGIHACNGGNVERIDNAIPDTVFEIHNLDDGPQRVYGIRDYFAEMVYWTFPNQIAEANFPYPNRILAYNYTQGTWSFFDDSITCFGYFQPQESVLWSSTTTTWSDPVLWGGAGILGLTRTIIAGNQEGFTWLIDVGFPEQPAVIQITDMAVVAGAVQVTAINHNFRIGDYVALQGIQDTNTLSLLNGTIAQVVGPLDANTFTLGYPTPYPVVSGTYQGGGLCERVPNLQLQTKQFNFYAEKGYSAQIDKVDFLVDRTDFGEITADYLLSSNTTRILPAAEASGAQLGTGILETSPYPTVTWEQNMARLWHTMYYMADGEYFQLYLYLTDEQLRDFDIKGSDFQLHAMIIHASPSSMRLQP